MSTLLYEDKNYLLTRYWGGDEKGVCLQITLAEGEFIQLTKDDLDEFIKHLNNDIKQM